MDNTNSYELCECTYDSIFQLSSVYSEINNERVETRKVEIFKDGTMGFADKHSNNGATLLCDQLMPSIEEIIKDSDCKAKYISAEEFEDIWKRAISQKVLP